MLFRRIIFAACLLFALDGGAAAAPPPSESVAGPGERLTLGCENAGVSLERIYSTYPGGDEWVQCIRLTDKGRITRLHRLQELKGLVHIGTCDAALRYVRLRTSPNTWNLSVGGAHSEMEIVTPAQAARLPAFGLKGNSVSMDPEPNNSPTGLSPIPGLGGVLPPTAYRRGGFALAQAVAVPGGFAVTRWTFTDEPVNGKFEVTAFKVSEAVTPDGGYTRTVLVQKRIDLPGTKLRLPTYSGE